MTYLKNEESKPVAAIIIAVIITVIILIAFFQFFWESSPKTKCINLEKRLEEKLIVIMNLRNLLEKEKAEFNKFKSDSIRQIAEMQNLNDALSKKSSLLSNIFNKIATRWNSFEGNFCDDKIIAETIGWMKAAKAEIEK